MEPRGGHGGQPGEQRQMVLGGLADGAQGVGQPPGGVVGGGDPGPGASRYARAARWTRASISSTRVTPRRWSVTRDSPASSAIRSTVAPSIAWRATARAAASTRVAWTPWRSPSRSSPALTGCMPSFPTTLRRHRQSPGQCALLVGEQVVAPVEGLPKGPVPRVVPAGRSVTLQHRELVAEPRCQVSEAQGATPAGRQLNRRC